MSRELDALCAEKVMGWTGDIVPHYSTNIADAWLLVEAVSHYVQLHGPNGYSEGWEVCVLREDKDPWTGEAKTAPMAITLAALKTNGVDVSKWENQNG